MPECVINWLKTSFPVKFLLRSFGTSQCLSRKCLPMEEEGFLCSLMCWYKCHSKTRPQQTSFASNLKILATRFKTPYGLYTVFVTRSNKISNCMKLSRRLWINNALFTNLNVTCAIQVMLVSVAGTYISALRNIKNPSPSIGKHGKVPKDLTKNFTVLKKCKKN